MFFVFTFGKEGWTWGGYMYRYILMVLEHVCIVVVLHVYTDGAWACMYRGLRGLHVYTDGAWACTCMYRGCQYYCTTVLARLVKETGQVHWENKSCMCCKYIVVSSQYILPLSAGFKGAVPCGDYIHVHVPL